MGMVLGQGGGPRPHGGDVKAYWWLLWGLKSQLLFAERNAWKEIDPQHGLLEHALQGGQGARAGSTKAGPPPYINQMIIGPNISCSKSVHPQLTRGRRTGAPGLGHCLSGGAAGAPEPSPGRLHPSGRRELPPAPLSVCRDVGISGLSIIHHGLLHSLPFAREGLLVEPSVA